MFYLLRKWPAGNIFFFSPWVRARARARAREGHLNRTFGARAREPNAQKRLKFGHSLS